MPGALVRRRSSSQVPKNIIGYAVLVVWFGTPLPAAWDDLRLRADVVSEYTDNLLHYSERRLDQFDSSDGAGGRFDGIESTDDVVTRLRGRSDYNWDLDKHGDLRVWLHGAYFFHLENDIADYGRASAGAFWEPTKADHIEISVDQTFDRFKKNYRNIDTLEFGHASYDQTYATLGYTRVLRKQKKKRWNLGLEYAHRARRYNNDYSDRDEDGDYLLLHTSYRLAKRLEARTALGYGEVDNDKAFVGNLGIDRSYDEYQVLQRFELQFPAQIGLRIDLKYRRRDYTTNVVEDQGRHNRTDDYYRAQLRVTKKWDNGLSLYAQTYYIENDSDREDENFDVDEAGYDEFTAALGLAYRF